MRKSRHVPIPHVSNLQMLTTLPQMETINKLLKKQAPKTNRRHALAGYDTPDGESNRADPLFVRWVSTKDGNRIGVPDDMVIGPVGRAFLGGGGLARGKMVEEVS